MSTRFEREFQGMPWKLTRALVAAHWHRAAENESKEWAWNHNLRAKRLAYLSEKRTERQARIVAEHGTEDQRRSRFFSAFEASPVRLPSIALGLSVGG